MLVAVTLRSFLIRNGGFDLSVFNSFFSSLDSFTLLYTITLSRCNYVTHLCNINGFFADCS